MEESVGGRGRGDRERSREKNCLAKSARILDCHYVVNDNSKMILFVRLGIYTLIRLVPI